MRPALLCLTAALLVAAGSADAQKLYRWVDKDGKVHYSDQVPPEAIDQAREELNQSGRTVDKVDRALTAEELATAKAAEEAAAARRKLEEDQAKMDAILLNSYGSAGDLERAYAERFDLLEQSLESARIGIKSQEKSLAELLAHAAGLEQQGKPVPDTIKTSLELARRQTQQQRDYLAKREAEKVSLQDEFASTLERYKALKAKASEPSPPR